MSTNTTPESTESTPTTEAAPVEAKPKRKRAPRKASAKKATAKKSTRKAAPKKEKAAPKEAKPKKEKVGAYPFPSKRSILTRLETDDGFVTECLLTMGRRQEERESGNGARRGFMSSHEARGKALVASARDGGLSPEELPEARTLVARYGRQLAADAREQMIAADPALAKVAEVFSAN